MREQHGRLIVEEKPVRVTQAALRRASVSWSWARNVPASNFLLGSDRLTDRNDRIRSRVAAEFARGTVPIQTTQPNDSLRVRQPVKSTIRRQALKRIRSARSTVF